MPSSGAAGLVPGEDQRTLRQAWHLGAGSPGARPAAGQLRQGLGAKKDQARAGQ